MSEIFKYAPEAYTTPAVSPLRLYVEHSIRYLKTLHPDHSEEQIRAFVDQYVQRQGKNPPVTILNHPIYGVTQEKTTSLTDYLSYLKGKIHTPSGSVYVHPSQKKSVLKDVLEEKVAERSRLKKLQFVASNAGDTTQAAIYKNGQTSAKIFNNSIIGAMNMSYGILYDMAGFNAITSVARHSVMLGYAHTERLLGSNIMVTSVEDILNYCVIHDTVCPRDQVQTLITDPHRPLYVPTIQDLMTWFQSCLYYYQPKSYDLTPVYRYLSQLDDIQRTYIYYVGDFAKLLQQNSDIFRAYFTEMFRRDIPIDPTSDPNELKSVEEDLFLMVKITNFDLIHHESKLDTCIQQYPDACRHLLSLCHHVDTTIRSLSLLWDTFFRTPVDLPNIPLHPHMVRRSVILSDTDSVIFTTSRVAKWWTPYPGSDQLDISAFAVYLLSKMIEHVFLKVSTHMGIPPEDRHHIAMKNEFYYPVFIRTAVKKHYLGIKKIQEGNLLKTPELDLKGGNLRGSVYPPETTTCFQSLLTEVMVRLSESPTIPLRDIIRPIVQHEVHIHRSLTQGEKTFLPVAPIREQQHYKDPLVSEYFFYMFWSQVFGHKFGEIVIPNKCFVIPISGEGRSLEDPTWLDQLYRLDRRSHEQFLAFRDTYPKKKISRIFIPQSLASIPDIFIPVMDTRKILLTNGRPFYMALKSFGIPYGHTKAGHLLLDYYTEDGLQIPFS